MKNFKKNFILRLLQISSLRDFRIPRSASFFRPQKSRKRIFLKCSNWFTANEIC